ncbi:MAG: tRNA preQ1(34) S-adenosylmethionine ribosyltransferase-isomerase QueA [Candidatus Kapaibacteriales bacterium]
MKLSQFKYEIPQKYIASKPASPRDSARMMVYNKTERTYEDKNIRDLLDIMKRGDCLVLNETKVFPARLVGEKEKTNAEIEVMLLRELKKEDRIWDVLVEPARKVRIGNKIYFNDGQFYCEVIDNTTSRGRTVRFSYDGDLFDEIEKIGHMPLPEYIKREATEKDKEDYQTVFANEEYLSSIAPPASNLHFTEEFLGELEDKGIRIAKLNLNIGQGIFEKIEVEDLSKHRMYSEYFQIKRDAADTINKSLKQKKQVYAVGSSVLRALESSVLTTGLVKPNKDWTDKYIIPNFEPKIATRLITNFHAPATPQLLLTAAFMEGGKKELFEAYDRAKEKDYRFLVYGDAMLII